MKIIKISLLVIVSEILLMCFYIIKHNYPQEAFNKDILVLKNGLIFLDNNQQPFTGKIVDTLDNKMIVNIKVVNGLMDGEYLLFNLTGNLSVSGFMKNNKSDGRWQYFYNNGQLQCEGNFKNDELIGKWVWFYENGLKKCEGIYSKGTLHGKCSQFDEQGRLSLVLNFQYGTLVSSIEVTRPILI